MPSEPVAPLSDDAGLPDPEPVVVAPAIPTQTADALVDDEDAVDLPEEESSSRTGLGPLLRSQGLGVCCGLATVILLAIGSVVMAATREGASAAIGMDDIRPFFTDPSLVHTWFYLLAVVVALYALNTLLATWHNVVRRVKAGIRAPSAYAAAIIHVSFVVALAAHGVGGLWSEERGEVVLSTGWQALPGGGEGRLLDFEMDTLPGGMPKEVRARVETRDAAGTTQQAVVGYNQPLSSGFGADLMLLSDQGEIPSGARFAIGDASCTAPERGSCALGDVRVELLGLVPPGHFGPQPGARVRITAAQAEAQDAWLFPTRGVRFADGSELHFLGLATSPAIALRVRHAPGNPWALASAILLGAGVLLMWRRFRPLRASRLAAARG